MHANAKRAAERLREESEEAAEQTRQRAEADARRRLDEATKEISRLSGLQTDVRNELAQLAQLISTELATARAARRKDGDGAERRRNGSQNGGGARDRK